MSAYSSCDITADGAKLALTKFVMTASDEALEELLNLVRGRQYLVRFRITPHPQIPRWNVANDEPIWE